MLQTRFVGTVVPLELNSGQALYVHRKALSFEVALSTSNRADLTWLHHRRRLTGGGVDRIRTLVG